MSKEADVILRVENIVKEYPGVIALDDVSMGFRKGEVHAIMGENGAGKSTLIKVISGAIQPDSGKIFVDEKLVEKYVDPAVDGSGDRSDLSGTDDDPGSDCRGKCVPRVIRQVT